jgi:hypothetical protein
VGEAPGVKNLRHGLLDGKCFDWGATVDPRAADWTWALVFAEGPDAVTVVFSADCKTVGLPRSDSAASLAPVGREYASFFAEHFPAAPVPRSSR